MSRVVTGKARDQALLRAKLTLHFLSPLEREPADALADRGAATLRDMFESAEEAADVLSAEERLARAVQNALPGETVREVEVVALHVVGESVQPTSHRALSSRPPPPLRRASSSQMLAVRESRLIPEGAPVHVVADTLVPLLRDAATRTLVGTLRAYDLTVVRNVEIDPRSSSDFGELVPLSVAAPGRFAEERGEELSRWSQKLGPAVLDRLEDEAATVACHFLQANLLGAGVDQGLTVGLIERASAAAFPGHAPLAALPRYLQGANSPAVELVTRVLALVSAEPKYADALVTTLTPTLQSLQDDFSFVAQQILLSGVRPTEPT